jgi:hypothetical protein
MVADRLMNWLGNCNCFVQGFADDVVILISGKFLSTWCGVIGLNVNADKISMALFSQTGGIWRVFSPQNSLILNNQVKYLGVILDSNLNWKFLMITEYGRAV